MSTRPSSTPHADTVEKALRWAIVSAEFEPGQRLSAEALAERYQVSPTPVREALARLAGDSLVTYLPQRGVRVAPLTLREAEEIYEIRGLIEPLAIERSVQSMDEGARSELKTRYDLMLERARGDIRNLDAEAYGEYEEAHTSFHHATLSHCGSSWLLRLTTLLSYHSLRYRYASIQLRDRHEHIADEHAAILAACLAGDADGASSAHHRHLEETRLALGRLLSSDAG